MNLIAIGIIRAAALFFRTLGPRACRFEPTCSAYAIEAFRTLSFFHAAGLTIKRLARCHPFTRGGLDQVPQKEISRLG